MATGGGFFHDCEELLLWKRIEGVVQRSINMASQIHRLKHLHQESDQTLFSLLLRYFPAGFSKATYYSLPDTSIETKRDS